MLKPNYIKKHNKQPSYQALNLLIPSLKPKLKYFFSLHKNIKKPKNYIIKVKKEKKGIFHPDTLKKGYLHPDIIKLWTEQEITDHVIVKMKTLKMKTF